MSGRRTRYTFIVDIPFVEELKWICFLTKNNQGHEGYILYVVSGWVFRSRYGKHDGGFCLDGSIECFLARDVEIIAIN